NRIVQLQAAVMRRLHAGSVRSQGSNSRPPLRDDCTLEACAPRKHLTPGALPREKSALGRRTPKPPRCDALIAALRGDDHAVLTTRLIAPESLSHWASSFSICLRPAAVNE